MSPPNCLAWRTKPSRIDEPPGKSELTLPVPCQLIVQPPDWRPMSSAPAPASRYRPSGFKGSNLLSFLSNTRDRRTASRASSRCASAPIASAKAAARLEGKLRSINPNSNLTFKMRVTASSTLTSVISPERTCANILSYRVRQSSGTMTMSIPALIA